MKHNAIFGLVLGSDSIRIAINARRQGVDVTLYVNDSMWHVSIGEGSGVPEFQLICDKPVHRSPLFMFSDGDNIPSND